jgi:hypothetical protein
MGLVGTEAVGEAEGIGELLVCQYKGIQNVVRKVELFQICFSCFIMGFAIFTFPHALVR